MVVHEKSKYPVRVARERAGLTQVQVAIRSRLSLSTLRNAERGLATKRTLRLLARVLSVGLDTLTERKEAP